MIARAASVVSVILALTLCPYVAADQCVDYGAHLRLVASVDTPGDALDVAVVNGYAYIADLASLQVVDISDPDSPSVVANMPRPQARCVLVSESHAYVAGGQTLDVVDISNPMSPSTVGSIDTLGWVSANDCVLSGNHVFIGSTSGLEVVDISEPTSPVLAGSYSATTQTVDVAVSEPYAYVLLSASLHVVDASTVSAPVLVGTIDLPPGRGQSVAIAGGHAYVLVSDDSTGSLQIIDISSPTAPILMGRVETGTGDAVIVPSSGGHAYIARDWFGLMVADVSNPFSPSIVGSVYTPGRAKHVAILDDRAYIAASTSGLQIADISNPASPPAAAGRVHIGRISDIAVSGSYAFAARGRLGLDVIDVANPHLASVVGTLSSSGGFFTAVAASGNMAYVIERDLQELQVVDVSNPAAPVVVGATRVGSDPVDVVISDGYVYVAARFSSLGRIHIVDVDDPTAPAVVGTAIVAGSVPVGLAVSDGIAYAATETFGGLVIVDVSDHDAPFVAGSVDTPGDARNVAVSGAYAYLADEAGGFHAIDVSDPTSPTIVGTVEMTDRVLDVAVSGNYAYVAAESAGLQVVDISNPFATRIVGGLHLRGDKEATWPARDVAVSSGLCYTGALAFDILLQQCDEGPLPVLISGFHAETRNQSVRLSWFTSFESTHDGFHLYRSGHIASGYSRLNDRILRGRSPYSYLDSTVLPAATYYYKLGAIDSQGHEVLHPPTSATTPPLRSFRTALAPGSPNPFRRETTLAFTLSARQGATLAIYDVTGRLVRQVVQGELPEGEHAAIWDGRDDAGLRVAGGTYFVRFNAGDESRAEKVVYLGGR